jgi:copper homeostasis protein (lipoprotein)
MKIFPTSMIAVILACCIFASCTSPKTSDDSTILNNPTPDDSSKNSLDWNGTYKGTIPCADCEGIEIILTIKSDETFEKSSNYLGKSDEILFEAGVFAWNDTGSIITLSSKSGIKEAYQVGENVLFLLDQEGNRISGNLSELYRLEKNLADDSLENKKWVLIELQGAPYQKGEDEKEIFLYFDNETSRFYGNTSCNAINGAYTIQEGNRISFGNAASTMMACPAMEKERIISELLKEVDNYSIGDNQLSLNKARMAPLARFAFAE